LGLFIYLKNTGMNGSEKTKSSRAIFTFVILAFGFLIAVTAQAQVNDSGTKIVTYQSDSTLAINNNILLGSTGRLRRGIYTTFDEFRRNSPSIQFEAETKDMNIRAHAIFGLALRKKMPCEKNTPVWGFCDGYHVYKNRTDYFNKYNTYDELLSIGRYVCYGMYYHHNSSTHQMSYGTTIEMGLDINDGTTFRLKKAVLKLILAKDAALLGRFKKERNKRMVLSDYLRDYSTAHPEEVTKLK
jgi:hypothetical protein